MAKRQLTLIDSKGIYAAWYDDETEQVTVQYARGLAKYRYSNFNASMANTMEQQSEHVGQWFRREVVLKKELYPVEKLD